MKDISDQSTSLEIILHEVQSDESLIDVISNLKYQIDLYESAISNAQLIIMNYSQQNAQLKKQNMQLLQRCFGYQKQLSGVWNQIGCLEKEREKVRGKEIQMSNQIEYLNDKLTKYEKTIVMLQDRLQVLNRAITKQRNLSKYYEKIEDEPTNSFKMQSQIIKSLENRNKKSYSVSCFESQPLKIVELASKKLDHKLINLRNRERSVKKIKTFQISNSANRKPGSPRQFNFF